MMHAVSIVWFWLPNSDSPLFMYIVIFVIYTWFNYIFRVEAALTNAAKHARSLYMYIHAHRFCIKKKLNRNRVFRQMRSARGNSIVDIYSKTSLRWTLSGTKVIFTRKKLFILFMHTILNKLNRVKCRH